jgi:RNA polymerase sigma-70 factor (ECF subfamily)
MKSDGERVDGAIPETFAEPDSTNDTVDRAMSAAMRAKEDLALAEKCIAGDRVAQMNMFHREKRRVHATLYRVLGSNTQMEDLVQEAFIEVFRSLASFRGEAQLSTWIDRITARVAYAYLGRNRGKWARLEAVPEMPSDDPSAESRVLIREAARRLYEVMDRLDAKQRLAFTLHVLDERPLKEVAQMMGASLVATKTRVWRARRELAKRARHDAALAGFVTEVEQARQKGAS